MNHRTLVSSSVGWLLLAAALAGADCRSNDKPTPSLANTPLADAKPAAETGDAPPNEGLTEAEAAKLIPGVDTDALTPKQRQDLVDLSRDTFCPCSAETVAACLRRGPDTCRPAVRLMQLAGSMIEHGQTEAAALMYIEAYYSAFDDSHRMELPREGPWKGAKDAPVVIEEFSDFQCPVCRAAHPALAELLKKYPHDVKLVFRYFPLPQHQYAAKAALCAAYVYGKGGSEKFWKMADHFFTHQEQLGDDEFKAAAREAGVVPEEMLRWIDQDPKYQDQIDADKKLGAEAKITGTPSIFLNGRQLVLPATLENLSWAVDDELEWIAHGKKWATK